MPTTQDVYKTSLALLTDLYQITMAYGYWKLGNAHHEAVFHMTYRKNPFGGGYALACGLHYFIDFIRDLRFTADDVGYLATLTGNDEKPLFEAGFLDYLQAMKLELDIDAVPEGTAVFPHEPLVRVRGPILQAQIIETPLLNMINFQTLIATKAARVCQAARGEPVLEFGLRRAQGIDGALAASRAAYVGGCAATSNLLAGKVFGIPVRGTHAHSWVMSFDDELEAFEAYARAMPNNCVFLVDTYDSLQGVRHAARVGQWLAAHERKLIGIRLDSGDLAYLSIEARRILDAAGLHDASILASNDLDENIIASLKDQGAAIAVWGVGTKLITAFDQPAMGGVYKLSALRDGADKPWQYKLKLSEQSAKISTPGVMQIRRYRSGSPVPGEDATPAPGWRRSIPEVDAPAEHEAALSGSAAREPTAAGEPAAGNAAAHRMPTGDVSLPRVEFIADAICNEMSPAPADMVIVDPLDMTRRKAIPSGTPYEELLVPIFRRGKVVYDIPSLDAVRSRAREQLGMFHAGIKRFAFPHQYPVGLEKSLFDLRTDLILKARETEKT